ncbi:MAG: preprotein translocase subunit SecE [Deltaproteobacteria bacterium]|nr:preprotein translocase subunit SecE [Deltaproteobacteria bacterium]
MIKKNIIVTICLIIAAAFLYYLASQITELIFDSLKVPVTREYGLAIHAISLFLAVIAFIIALKNKKWMDFLTEALTELSKVTYPTKKESGQSAVVVIVMVSIATVFLAVFDTMWLFLTKLILSN